MSGDLAPARDRWDVIHARVTNVSGRQGVLVCVLLERHLDEFVSRRIRSWTFPVTCLWCFARLVRA